MLKQIKRAVLTAGKSGRLFNLAGGSHWRRSRLLIVGYHGVSIDDEHQWNQQLYISPEQFRERMETLKRCQCTVLSLDEGLDLLYQGKLPERAVVLTFDDGAVDFKQVIRPILKEYGFPSTLYLTTYWVTVGRPVVPGIWSYLLWKKKGQICPAPKALGADLRFDLTSRVGRSEAQKKLVSFAKLNRLNGHQKDDLTQELARNLGADYSDLFERRILQLLKPEEVRELHDDGVSVQLHMHHHRSPEEEENFKQELNENRDYIANLLGTSPQHFCYPSGRYKEKFLPWLEEMDIKSATTCDPGLASAKTASLLLPRLVDTSHLAPVEFESWITGIAALIPTR